jgi:hypothetical protein
MADTHSYKVADKLYLVRHPIAHDTKAPAKAVEVPTDHIMIYDCSGSMWGDLPKIREQVKKKLPKMLKKDDTFSAIWFSGRGQCGILLEKEPVATLTDLAAVNKAVDRWLTPNGLTGFKEPLEKAIDLADKLGGNGRAISVTFMSDGCDNQWSRGDILKVTEKLGPKVSSSTFVEYGYYADRPLLTAMAEKAGGVLIFAEDFDRYEPAFETAMTKKASGAKRVEVSIKGDPVGGFAYALHDGDLMTFAASSGTIAVPEDLAEVLYLSPSAIGTIGADVGEIARFQDVSTPQGHKHPNNWSVLAPAYAALSLFAVRMKPDIVFPLLKATGDVAFIEQFANCFGKQKYSAFMEGTKAAAFDAKKILTKGYDPNKVPRDNAFTVMHVLELLQIDPQARLLLDSPDFKYSKIGRGRLDASADLSETELEELHKLTDQLSKEKDVTKIKDLNAKIAAFTADKAETLKFVPTPQTGGYPILKLTFNEDRPNISILTKKPGTIDLSKRLKDAPSQDIPANFETFVYRNYTIIKDGLVNVDKLPVRLSAGTIKKLKAEGVVPQEQDMPLEGETTTILLDLKALPVVNRQMVQAVSAKAFFTTQYELVKAQAAQKVFNSYAKELLPEKKVAGFIEKYGEAGAKWLKEQGIGDGYQPPATKQAESTDFYMGKELAVSLAKLSKLPSLKEAKESITKGKMTPTVSLMADTIKKVDAFVAKTHTETELQTWLDAEKKAATERVRKLIFDIAQTTFALIVGQVWFTEFASIDENSMEIDFDGQQVACKAEMKDVQIKI